MLFEPFFSADPHDLGLDLTLAKRLAEVNGGKIEAVSGLNQGTAVTLRFPSGKRDYE